MTTQILGIKEFRQNITSLWKKSRAENIRYIVMYHSQPIFEVNPLMDEDFILENYIQDIAEARNDIKCGNVYTQEEVFKELGL
ncbi:hypothetical protein COB57_02795 [Candidatus Peregrinibacteria bacterium]|nr:MAG: hypothetical protein COB57_02795 [Candidatus Peregrinibacteria bacterium]